MTATFATCDFCDVHKGDSSGDFRVLPPVFRDFGALTTFSGPVETVKCFEDNTLVKATVAARCAGRCWAAIWVLLRHAMAGPVW